MTVMEFFGCSFLAFGPPFALFLFTIIHDPVRIIIMIAAAFFWLLALLLSSALWFAVVPLKGYLIFGVLISVGIQELFRALIYLVLRKAETGLQKITLYSAANQGCTGLVENRHMLAYVAGYGFGVISGAFSLVNIVADAVGPGTMGLKTGSQFFFLSSASVTLAFILLHVVWSVIFFDGMSNGNRLQIGAVVAAHYFATGLTFLNRYELYFATLLPLYGLLLAMGAYAFGIAGGSYHTLKLCIAASQ